MVTESQRERLIMLMEECAEVQKECAKILRHGYENYHPNDPSKISNGTKLEMEITDLLAIIDEMNEKDIEVDYGHLYEVWNAKKRWTYHQ